MHSIPLKRFLSGFVLVLMVGCSKESAPEPQSTPEPPPPPASVSKPSVAAPPAAAPQPAGDVVSDRTIDYIRGRIFQKDYDRARQGLLTLEGKSLTPAQQRAVAELKAQIPPG